MTERPRPRVMPVGLRAEALRRELGAALRARSVRKVVRAPLAFVAPGRWPPAAAVRGEVLDRAMRRGDVAAARVVLADAESSNARLRPGTPAALRQARAIEMLAGDLEQEERRVETVIAAYLRGEFSPPPAVPRAPDPDALAAAARSLAGGLRGEGHGRPVVVATFPGFSPNPYGRLMEQAYGRFALAPLAVDQPEAIDAIVAGAAPGGYDVIVHANAPDRFVHRERDARALTDAAESAVAGMDRWLAAGATLVYSVHNGARLTDQRGPAEQRVAQALADRAAVIHVLTASTPERLASWIRLDPDRIVHVPHPSYAGAYGPAPDRSEARRRLGLDDRDLAIGLVGTLTDRKGGLALVGALRPVPEPLPDGRRVRVILAGMLLGNASEDLIRAALAEPRVIPRFGLVADDEIPAILAALDVGVIPYGHWLNSGWLHLGLTYGLPFIAPRDGTAGEIAQPPALRLFGDEDGSLEDALAGASSLATPAARAAALASVADLDPEKLSARFAEALRAAVDARA